MFEFFRDVFFVSRSGVEREPQMLHRKRTVTTGSCLEGEWDGPKPVQAEQQI